MGFLLLNNNKLTMNIILELTEKEFKTLADIVNEAPVPRRISDIVMIPMETAINKYNHEKQNMVAAASPGALDSGVRSDSGSQQHNNGSATRDKKSKTGAEDKSE